MTFGKKKTPPKPRKRTTNNVSKSPSTSSSYSGGLMTTVIEGFAFGTGSGIARNVVDSMFSTSSTNDKKSYSLEGKTSQSNPSYCSHIVEQAQHVFSNLCLEKQSEGAMVDEHNDFCHSFRNQYEKCLLNNNYY